MDKEVLVPRDPFFAPSQDHPCLQTWIRISMLMAYLKLHRSCLRIFTYITYWDGLNPSFQIWFFKPFGPRPIIDFSTTPKKIAPHNLYVINAEVEIMVQDKRGLIIDCHWWQVAPSGHKCSRRARDSCPLINGTQIYERSDCVLENRRKRCEKPKVTFCPFPTPSFPI